MDECFHIDRDFLTGSYKRWTKTKPLKDVDISAFSAKTRSTTDPNHPANFWRLWRRN